MVGVQPLAAHYSGRYRKISPPSTPLSRCAGLRTYGGESVFLGVSVGGTEGAGHLSSAGGGEAQAGDVAVGDGRYLDGAHRAVHPQTVHRVEHLELHNGTVQWKYLSVKRGARWRTVLV